MLIADPSLTDTQKFDVFNSFVEPKKFYPAGRYHLRKSRSTGQYNALNVVELEESATLPTRARCRSSTIDIAGKIRRPPPPLPIKSSYNKPLPPTPIKISYKKPLPTIPRGKGKQKIEDDTEEYYNKARSNSDPPVMDVTECNTTEIVARSYYNEGSECDTDDVERKEQIDRLREFSTKLRQEGIKLSSSFSSDTETGTDSLVLQPKPPSSYENLNFDSDISTLSESEVREVCKKN